MLMFFGTQSCDLVWSEHAKFTHKQTFFIDMCGCVRMLRQVTWSCVTDMIFDHVVMPSTFACDVRCLGVVDVCELSARSLITP